MYAVSCPLFLYAYYIYKLNTIGLIIDIHNLHKHAMKFSYNYFISKKLENKTKFVLNLQSLHAKIFLFLCRI